MSNNRSAVGDCPRQAPHHPAVEDIDLLKLFNCLGDPIRVSIVMALAKSESTAPELRCNEFGKLAGKTVLAYHFAKLRESGLVWTRLDGNRRFMRLRRADLDRRFPGLLDAIIRSLSRARSVEDPIWQER
jgi:DNA-binding transcriptional ArsR family regulator